EYVDRLEDWLAAHRDVPSFVFLHVFDPHAPYEPNRPYDTAFADPKGREEYVRGQQALKTIPVTNSWLALRGMASPEELTQAGVDPAKYLQFSKDWYDGSILAMDHELARLVEWIEERKLKRETLVTFYADHGEEFHEHGRM